MSRRRETWYGYRVLQRGRTECMTTGDQAWVDRHAARIAGVLQKPVMVIEHFGSFFHQTAPPEVVSIWQPAARAHSEAKR
jgi:hypothetical protein